MRRFLWSFSAVGLGIAIVLVAFAQGSLARSTQIGLSLTSKQPGSPVTLLSLKNTAEGPFRSVELRNDSQQEIRSVTFGVAAFGKNDPSSKPLFFDGKPVTVHLKPGEKGQIEPRVVTSADVRRIGEAFPSGADAQFGVLRVQFAAGEDWVYDPRTTGGFAIRKTGSSSSRPCGRWLRARWNAAAALIAQSGYYTCETSENREYCDNRDQGQNCTNSICSGDPCPMQKCVFHQIE